ncbi:unnamed protein product, partial [Rotaria magnacalcarata]
MSELVSRLKIIVERINQLSSSHRSP